jgi:hypothetical protein
MSKVAIRMTIEAVRVPIEDCDQSRLEIMGKRGLYMYLYPAVAE